MPRNAIMRSAFFAVAIFVCGLSSPAAAEERDYCPARPGLGSPTCTIDPGKVSVEVGIAGWTQDKEDGIKTDAYDLGDTQVRVGVSENAELLFGWQAYSATDYRTPQGKYSQSGIGDAIVGAKLNLKNPDGSGFSVAVQPFVTLPVGDNEVSAGDWGAGIIIPVSYELPGGASLQYTH